MLTKERYCHITHTGWATHTHMCLFTPMHRHQCRHRHEANWKAQRLSACLSVFVSFVYLLLPASPLLVPSPPAVALGSSSVDCLLCCGCFTWFSISLRSVWAAVCELAIMQIKVNRNLLQHDTITMTCNRAWVRLTTHDSQTSSKEETTQLRGRLTRCLNTCHLLTSICYTDALLMPTQTGNATMKPDRKEGPRQAAEDKTDRQSVRTPKSLVCSSCGCSIRSRRRV